MSRRTSQQSLLSKVAHGLRAIRTRRAFEREYGVSAPSARGGRLDVVVVLDHPHPKGNVGCIVRSADAFGARAVYVVGTRFFDPVSAMGSLRNQPVRFVAEFRQAHAELVSQGYTLFALEPTQDFESPTLLQKLSLPEKTAFVLGNERTGIGFSPAAFERIVCASIAHDGRATSLNVSVAAGIALYEYSCQHGLRSGAATTD